MEEWLKVKEKRKVNFLADIKNPYIEQDNTIQLNILDILLNSENPLKTIKRFGESPVFISNCIQYCIIIRPNQINKFLRMLCIYSSQNGVSNTICGYIKSLLIHKGFIPEPVPETDLKSLICPFAKGSIEEAIMNDDADTFISFTNKIDFDPTKLVEIQGYYPICYVENENYLTSNWGTIRVTYMQLISFFGSVKCFRAALLMKKFDATLYKIGGYAIAGGSSEIITTLEKRGAALNMLLDVSFRYHRNDISDWILKNQKIIRMFPTQKAIESYNFRSLFFFMENDYYDNDNDLKNALISSAKVGCVSLTKYFFEKYDATRKSYPTSYSINNTYGTKSAVINIVIKTNNFKLLKLIIKKEVYEYPFEEEEEENEELYTFLLHLLNDGCIASNLYMAKYLINKYKINTFNINQKVLIDALKNSNMPAVKYLSEDCKLMSNNFKTQVLECLHFRCSYEVLKYLVEKFHVETNVKDSSGRTLLHLACNDNNNLELVKYLIDVCGLDVEEKDNSGRTPLKYAFENNYDAMKYLLEEKDAKIYDNYQRYLICAIDKKDLSLMKLIFEKNIENFRELDIMKDLLRRLINTKNLEATKYFIEVQHFKFNDEHINLSEGELREYLKKRCLLHEECRKGMLQTAKLLIEKKNYYIEQLYNEETPLYAASESGNLSLLKYLIEDCHANIEAISKKSIIIAAMENNIPFVKYLCEHCNIDVNYKIHINCSTNQTCALFSAVRNNNLPLIKYLIEEAHADVEILVNIDGYMRTALHIACLNGNLPIVKYLIEEAHAKVNNPETNQYSKALCIACQREDFAMTKYLVEEAHADTIFIQPDILNTIIEKENFEFANYLITKCNMKDSKKKFKDEDKSSTTLQRALIKGNFDIVKALVENGDSQFDATMLSGATSIEIFKFFVEKYIEKFGAEAFKKSDIYENEFSLACLEGNMNMIKYIVEECHLKVFHKDAVQNAFKNNNIDVIKYLIDELHLDFFYGNIRFCIDEVRNYYYEKCALHNACKQSNFSEVKKLIEEKHYNTEQVFEEETPLSIASTIGCLPIVKYLVDECHVQTNTISSEAIVLAGERGDFEFIKYLVEKCNADGKIFNVKSYIKAIENNNLEHFKFLKEVCNAPLKIQNPQFATSNFWKESKILYLACKNEATDIVKYVVKEMHTNVNEQISDINNNSLTPLHMACIKGNLQIIKFLVEEGHADTKIKDTNGWTALHFACFNYNVEAVKYLVDVCHINIEEENNSGQSSLTIAKQEISSFVPNYEIKKEKQKEIVEYLQQRLESK